MRAALDLQALQCARAGPAARRRVSGLAAWLAGAGRLAAGLLAPEEPVPDTDVDPSRLVWDGMATARRSSTGGAVALVVPEPFLHLGPGEPSGRVGGTHWAEVGVPLIVCAGDLIELADFDGLLPNATVRSRFRVRAEWAASADLLIVESEAGRERAIQELGCAPERVSVLSAWAGPAPGGGHESRGPDRLGALDGRPFVLIPDMDRIPADPTLDVPRLVAPALSALRALGVTVVVAGGWAGLPADLVRVDASDPAVARALFERAALTVLPHEAGWSAWTAAEALATGCPVAGPSELGRLGDLLAGGRNSPGQPPRADWGDLLDSLRPRPARRPAPVRLAVVGPFPPHGGGIGAYNARMIEAMGDGAGADAITTSWTQWQPGPGTGKAHVESFGVDVRPASYDGVVYTLGNSDGHLPAVEAALRHPGWLWLHETRLPAIVTTAFSDLTDEQFEARLARWLDWAYPGRRPWTLSRSHLDLAEAGVGMIAPLAAAASGILVNSTAARHSLELDLPPLVWRPPIHVLAPGCPPVREARRRPGWGVGRPLVASFGVVSMSKRPDLLVDAAGLAGVDLAFVGPCPPILEEVINHRAELRGLAGRVSVAGAVGDGEWWEWMERATVAVQLREHSSGELSAAILDAFSAGVPVVTNLPAARDYPQDAVSLLSGPEPDAVAARLVELLADADALEGLGAGGRAFAAAHQMADLARALVEIVAGVAAQPAAAAR